MLDRVWNTKDMKVQHLRGLSYGRTHTGKTRFGATFPKPLFLAAQTEDGIVSLRKLSVDVLDIYTPADMSDAVDELEADAVVGKLRWQSLIVDSLSIYSEQWIDAFLKERAAKLKKDSEKVKNLRMRKPDWGLLDSHIRSLSVRLHSLPIHVWWMALEKYEKDDEGKILKCGPMLYGQRSEKLIAMVNIMLYHQHQVTGQNQPDVFQCRCKPFSYYDAKDRYDALPNPMAPNFSVMKKALGL